MQDQFGDYSIQESTIEMPTLSIVMAIKNGLDYLPEAIDSIQKQSFKNWELILLDDGSNEETANWLKHIASKDMRIRLITQSNIGLTKSLIRGIGLAKGTYVVRHDGDDVSSPHRFSVILKYLEQENFDIVFSRAKVFGKDVKTKIVPASRYMLGFSTSQLKFSNVFVHGSFAAKREVFASINYDPTFRFAQDYDLFSRFVLSNFKIAVVMEPLYQLRDSLTSISRDKAKEQIECAKQICEKNFHHSTFFIPSSNGLKRFSLQLLRHLFLLVFFFSPNKRIKLV